jgi:trehalose/maltose transport system permease protein
MPSTSKFNRVRVRAAWIFLAPMLVVLAMVAGWPLLRTIWFSFTDANLADFSTTKFVGFDNYLQHGAYGWGGLFVDADWWLAVWNTLFFSVWSVVIETTLGLAVALTLNANFKGRGLIRAAILIPWAIPTIVSARIWAWMMHDQFGILNDMMMRVGLIASPIAWTADLDTAMWAVVIVDVWKTTPFMALLCLAALQMLPTDCYEAAKLDGIHPVRLFFKVTLPLIKPALMVAVLFRALDALRIFDLIYVLTSGSKDTMSMSGFARERLVDFQEVGYGSAASTSLFLVIALITAAYLVASRVKFEGEAG